MTPRKRIIAAACTETQTETWNCLHQLSPTRSSASSRVVSRGELCVRAGHCSTADGEECVKSEQQLLDICSEWHMPCFACARPTPARKHTQRAPKAFTQGRTQRNKRCNKGADTRRVFAEPQSTTFDSVKRIKYSFAYQTAS